MSRILIVEDSPVEQALLQGLLRNRWPDLELASCSDVPQALLAIRQERPDLVVADLNLPGRSGSDLFDLLQGNEREIPVILITGDGSEEAALRAIQAGATSYVPRLQIGKHLLDAIDKILRLSRKNAARRRLMGFLFHQDLRFSIENDLELVGPFIDYVRDHLETATPFTVNETNHICLALHESLTNAINHGNLELDSELRQEDERVYYDLGEQRRRQHPYCDRHVYVAMTLTASEVDFRIRDEGPGFDAAAALEKAREINLDRIGGRGLLLIRAFMDTLSFNERGNEVRFSKRTVAALPAPEVPANAIV